MGRRHRKHERDQPQHPMLRRSYPTCLDAHASPPHCHHQAVAATPASLHTNVRKPCLPLIRCTCSAMGVILGGNSVCSCAAACCITSAVAPCFFKSLR